MTELHDPQQKLEALIDRTLRAQPPRTAPQTLQMRVMSEIERRATLQWSRMNFMRWPLAGRVAFVVLCIATAKLLLVATTWGATQMLAVVRFIPLDWAMGALIFAAAIYATLFAVGAVAYRTLSIER